MPRSEAEFKALIEEARRTNQERDKVDGRPFTSHRASEQQRTILAAIKAGIRNEDWTCVAEAYAMLEDYSRATAGPPRMADAGRRNRHIE